MMPPLYRYPWMDKVVDAFRDELRRHILSELAPRLHAWREQGFIPHESWRGLGEMGAILPELPEEYGGAGAPLAYQLVLQDELAREEIPANLAVNAIAAHYILD